jgi:hypothetical protein
MGRLRNSNLTPKADIDSRGSHVKSIRDIILKSLAQPTIPQGNSGFANDGFANCGFANDGFANDGFANCGFANDGFRCAEAPHNGIHNIGTSIA